MGGKNLLTRKITCSLNEDSRLTSRVIVELMFQLWRTSGLNNEYPIQYYSVRLACLHSVNKIGLKWLGKTVLSISYEV